MCIKLLIVRKNSDIAEIFVIQKHFKIYGQLGAAVNDHLVRLGFGVDVLERWLSPYCNFALLRDPERSSQFLINTHIQVELFCGRLVATSLQRARDDGRLWLAIRFVDAAAGSGGAARLLLLRPHLAEQAVEAVDQVAASQVAGEAGDGLLEGEAVLAAHAVAVLTLVVAREEGELGHDGTVLHTREEFEEEREVILIVGVVAARVETKPPLEPVMRKRWGQQRVAGLALYHPEGARYPRVEGLQPLISFVVAFTVEGIRSPPLCPAEDHLHRRLSLAVLLFAAF